LTDIDLRADIYSLGATAFFLLTGRPPFRRPFPVQTMAAHLTDPPPSLRAVNPALSATLEAVVLRCMAKAPADRYPDIAAVERALAEAAD
jgi:serine/threonine-protein kinase